MQKLVVFAAVLLLSTPFPAQIPTNLLHRLQTASIDTRLSGLDVQPWHLKVTFDLFREDGVSEESGTLEEWWAAPDRSRIVISSPTYSAIQTSNGNQLFRSTGKARPPQLIADLLRQVTQPLPDASFVQDARPLLQKSRVGAVELECITLGNDPVQGLGTPCGLFPTYCFDAGSLNLRISYSNGTSVVIRNHVTRFQNKAIAREIVLKARDAIALRGKVEQLVPYTPLAGELDPTPAEQLTDDPVEVSAAEMARFRLRGTFPAYPRAALEAHRIGVVIVRALIGKDGLVHSVVPVYSPDRRLTEASLDAVRQWTYRPFRLNGQIRDVETTITMTFNLL